MNVVVDKIKDKFLKRINVLYNKDVYFVENCINFPEKYELSDYITDLQLRIFFEENNKIIISGKTIKYCDKNSKKKVKIVNIKSEISDEINIINHYIVDDKWDKIEW